MLHLCSLVAVFGDILDALLQVVSLEIAAGGGDNLATGYNLRLQERGLAEQVERLCVIAGNLYGYHIAPFMEIGSYVVAVDAIEIVCCHAWAVPYKLSVYTQAVDGRCSYAYVGITLKINHRTESQRQVYL